ncbi:MAG: hypothetical protein L0Z50_34455 [Verrucomicrobiales bacterium]|nr:hypothetical protein [Verrucomicrobiales bacterium]
MLQFTKARILGWYLVFAALLEFGAYRSARISVVLRPRAGWTALLVTQGMNGDVATALPELFSAFWLLSFGILLIGWKRPMKTYVTSEVLLAVPTLLFATGLLISGGGHVFFFADGFKMLLISLIFTFFPILLAFFVIRESGASNSL